MTEKKRVSELISRLEAEYPDSECSLDYEKDYELLFATRLAAQCTDERVNQVTPILYAKYPTLEDIAAADIGEFEEIIHPCGFFRIKARDIIACAAVLVETYGGRVPDTMEELLALPGVGRKTANLVLGDVFHKPAVVTDTHCIRLTNRMGLTVGKDPAKVEAQLWKILPPEKANNFCHRLVLHGRAVCPARSPRCGACVLGDICPKNGV